VQNTEQTYEEEPEQQEERQQQDDIDFEVQQHTINDSVEHESYPVVEVSIHEEKEREEEDEVIVVNQNKRPKKKLAKSKKVCRFFSSN